MEQDPFEDAVKNEIISDDDPSSELDDVNLEDIKQYLFYCCPDCDYIQKDGRKFQSHYLKHANPRSSRSSKRNIPEVFEDNVDHLSKEDMSGLLADLEVFQEQVQCYLCEQDLTGHPGLAEKHRILDHANLNRLPVTVTTHYKCDACGLSNDPGRTNNYDPKDDPGPSNLIVDDPRCQCGKLFKFTKTFRWQAKLDFQEALAVHEPCEAKKKVYYSKPSKCRDCPRVFKRWVDMERHYAGVHSKHKPYQCDHCGQQFGSLNILKAHIRRTHDKATHPCSQCGKSYKKTALANHMRMVHSSKNKIQVLCQDCGKTYKSRTAYSFHKRQCNVKSGVDLLYKCDYCPLSFGNYAAKIAHNKFHLNQIKKTSKQRPRLTCCDCGIAFHTKEHLDNHSNACDNNKQ